MSSYLWFVFHVSSNNITDSKKWNSHQLPLTFHMKNFSKVVSNSEPLFKICFASCYSFLLLMTLCLYKLYIYPWLDDCYSLSLRWIIRTIYTENNSKKTNSKNHLKIYFMSLLRPHYKYYHNIMNIIFLWYSNYKNFILSHR